ncbi:AAA-10 domain containing protein [Pyrenophora tritici-repentis]|nr:AAA-10 domain containing protein [Pyrenophora tritici-repentis]KAI1525783.1 AAA-10 domain containing protein [Pyrenophora tritici-repentis]
MILRKMAIESQGLGAFDYNTFRDELSATKFASGQDGPMKLRLDLLESFMKRCKYSSSILANNENDFLAGTAGSLTIVDLTDPVIDADSACVLFDICLSVFIQQTQCGKIVALDEAHNYMAEGSGAAKAFTEKLLRTVREQRHQAVRVVIATQEPSINTQLLDLCSITMVHRCTSPAWFNVLKQHVAALYLNLPTSSQAGVGSDEKSEVSEDDRALFHKIVRLKLGESLLFCPSAVVKVVGEGIERIEGSYVRFKTRQRVTADGGKSKLAAEGTQGTGPMDATVESGLERVRGGDLVVSGTGRGQGPRRGRRVLHRGGL